jgi:hypothetical protein
MRPHHKPQKIVKLVPQEGMLYRVRDKDWVKLWGEGLSWDAAHKLKEYVVGNRLSKTARVEPMSVVAPKKAPPIENIGRVALANETRPADVHADDELDGLEEDDDAGAIDRLIDRAVIDEKLRQAK